MFFLIIKGSVHQKHLKVQKLTSLPVFQLLQKKKKKARKRDFIFFF